MLFAAGKRLSDRYEIIATLGKGGMGEVYRAKDLRLQREVAIKILPEHLAQNTAALARFEREARALAAVSHSNILTIYDFATDQGISFVVMELLEGENLRAHLSHNKPSLQKSLEIGIGIAQGLSFAHAKGIIHRDIKPENIFITSRGEVKILDFGLARTELIASSQDTNAPTETGVSVAGAIMGTVPYMAPEQLRGTPLDVRCDIFSCGVVLYEMVAGKHPFAHSTPADTISAILNESPPKLEAGISQETIRVISRCLEKDRDRRFQTAAELASSLDSSLGTTAVASAVPKRWLIRSTIAAVAVVLLMVSSIFLFRSLTSHQTIHSMAILPFVNSLNDPQTEYLSDGVTESIITKLSQLPELHVMAHDTVFSYKGRRIDPRKVGRELSVDAVVTGQIVQQGDVMEIRVNLVNVKDGSELWGEQYRRKFQDIFAIQDEIARTISEKLELKLTGDEKKLIARHSTNNPEAYQLYLKGHYYHVKESSEEDYQKAADFYQQAIDKDPNYAVPYASLSMLYESMAFEGVMPASEAKEKAEIAIQKGLEIDNTLPDIHLAVGGAAWTFDWNWGLFEAECRKALAINPNHAETRYLLAQNLRALGRFDEAIAEGKKAVELDPRSTDKNRALGVTYFWSHQYDQAIAQFGVVLHIDPNYAQAHDYLADVYARKGMHQQAISEEITYLKMIQDEKGASALQQDFKEYGYEKAKHLQFQRLLDVSKGVEQPPIWYAAIYTQLGDKEQAFLWLGKALEERAPWLTYIKTDIQFESLHSDPRFTALLKKIGLPV